MKEIVKEGEKHKSVIDKLKYSKNENAQRAVLKKEQGKLEEILHEIHALQESAD